MVYFGYRSTDGCKCPPRSVFEDCWGSSRTAASGHIPEQNAVSRRRRNARGARTKYSSFCQKGIPLFLNQYTERTKW